MWACGIRPGASLLTSGHADVRSTCLRPDDVAPKACEAPRTRIGTLTCWAAMERQARIHQHREAANVAHCPKYTDSSHHKPLDRCSLCIVIRIQAGLGSARECYWGIKVATCPAARPPPKKELNVIAVPRDASRVGAGHVPAVQRSPRRLHRHRDEAAADLRAVLTAWVGPFLSWIFLDTHLCVAWSQHATRHASWASMPAPDPRQSCSFSYVRQSSWHVYVLT